MLQITSNPVGKSKERRCYIHPDDPTKAIKVSRGNAAKRSRREIKFYRKLKKRGYHSNRHIPKFYGLCDTNLGKGIIVDLIRDYDGQISKPLLWYLVHGYPIEDFEDGLDDLLESFLQNLIMFNDNMTIKNLLFQKRSMSKGRLIAIDGLGDARTIDWRNLFPALVRRKIKNRWTEFILHLYQILELRTQRE